MKISAIRNRITTIAAALLLAVGSLTAQTATTTHVVGRGETLASIAAHYGVGVDKIIALNPDAAQFVYVGMELTIPRNAASPSNASEQGSTVFPYSSSQASSYADSSSSSYDTTESPWDFFTEVGYGFITGDPYMFRADLGATYAFQEKGKGAFAAFGLGYTGSFANEYSSYKGDGYRESETTDIDMHMLTIPLNVGFAFASENANFALTPFAGLDLNIGLSGKLKNKSYSTAYGHNSDNKDIKIGGKLGIAARAGLTLRLWCFDVTGAYVFPLNDNQKVFYLSDESFPMVSIGFGF